MAKSFAHRRPSPIELLENRILLATVPVGFSYTTLAAGPFNRPTAMEVAKDGRIFITEQEGAIKIIKNGVQTPNPLMTIPDAQINAPSNTERGLLGFALDPLFEQNNFFYVYYTAETPAIHNRISRFTMDGDTADLGTEFVLMDLPNLGATNHNGGAIHFGPDGKLYAGVGENANGSNSQLLSNPLGKILRINSNGSIPGDNPFFNDPNATGQGKAIWALGLRNPFTFAFQPGTGKMHINDVGASSFEEINLGEAGGNYGWPNSEGLKQPNDTPTTIGTYHDPIFNYGRGIGTVIAGGVFYNPKHVMFPAEYLGSYFFADDAADWIHRLLTNNTEQDFGEASNAPVDFKLQDDGSMLVLRGAGGGGGTLDIVKSTSIQGKVFNDPNSNGTKEQAESFLAGWTVYDDANNNGVLDAGEESDVTDANGLYVLGGLSTGTHNVRQVIQTGYRKTLPGQGIPGYSVVLAAGQASTGNDFGNTTNILIAGTVYNDSNHNGMLDNGEQGIASVVVNIISNNQTIATRTTDNAGFWQVKGLAAGTGSAEIVPPQGFVPVAPTGGVYTGSMTSGERNQNLNFGLTPAFPAIAPVANSLHLDDPLDSLVALVAAGI